MQSQMMLFQNQPDHRRLRTLASGAFTPRMAESYRPYIDETVHHLLDQVQGKKDGGDLGLCFSFSKLRHS